MTNKKTKAQVSTSTAVDGGVGGPLPSSGESSQVQQAEVDKPIDTDPSGLKVVARLTPEQYWEWRTTTCELQLAEKELHLATSQSALLAKELETAQLRLSLHRHTAVVKASGKKEEMEAEYQRFRAELEKKIGTSLSNKVIDETFAVKELDAVESK